MKNFFLLRAYILVIVTTMAAVNTLASEEKGLGSRESFNRGWLFARFGPMPDGSTKEEPTGMEKQGFNDAMWRSLDLPHDWGIEGPFRKDLPSNTGKLPWAGIGWYRKHFKITAQDKGKRFFVDFDGAMSHAKVWLNGEYLGEWPYGYASFRLEMTAHIRYTGENVLSVRLDNPPNSSRWYPGGGIYRNVWLVKTAPVHVAHWGSFVTTPKVSPDTSVVRIQTEVDNQSDAPATISVLVEISEIGKNAILASTPETKLMIPAGATGKCEADVTLRHPKLWDLQSPNLYCATTSIRQNGHVVESVRTVFGIRTAKFTADNGFLLNGKRVHINGVCNHHDLGPLGTAVNEAALERQIRLLQEMGCNAIRTSHNPPAPELLDLCDRLGMLVLDEAFDCWEHGKTPNDYSTLFKEWHEKDIRAFLRRDRNHPSVIAWSSGNEIQEQWDGVLAGQLREIFHSVDPSRPVSAACDNPQAGFDGFQHSVDVFGYNYKPHLYARFREVNPTIPLFGTETASCVSTFGEYFFPVSKDKGEGFFDEQVSSYDLYAPPWATIPDVEFEAEDMNPFVAGEFVWTGFDYLGEPTPYYSDTSSSRSSYFGILDLCGFKKDRFYLYQARWRPDLPMAHILPHWNWPDRVGKITPVQVYTSGDEAELFLNGKSLGRKKKGPYEYRLRWGDVIYTPGEVRVVAYRNGQEWATDIVKTTGPASGLELSADRKVIKADGSELAFVTVRIVDKNGLGVPGAANSVHFSISGPAVLAAVGNGDPTNHDSFQSDQYRAFHGQCLLVIRSEEGKRGPVRVEVESEGLAGGVTLITCE
jgi:beta-galactosidase